MSSSEHQRVLLLRELFARGQQGAVTQGIGDDAAVLAPPPGPLVWTIDAAVDGVHFRRDWLSFAEIGYRATMAAASDLAAMGATPLALLSALVLPATMSDEDLLQLARGQREAADALDVSVAGGNLARGEALSVTTTALGHAAEALRRDGARPGDAVYLAGPVGLSAAGLRLLERGALSPRTEAERAALSAFRRPTARIAAGLAASHLATAAIDVSDGLAQDLAHVARASQVGVVLDPTTLVSPALSELGAALGVSALDLALYGGEDYALVVVASAGARLEGFTRVGGCVPRHTVSGDVSLILADGSLAPVNGGGFDHFSPGSLQ